MQLQFGSSKVRLGWQCRVAFGRRDYGENRYYRAYYSVRETSMIFEKNQERFGERDKLVRIRQCPESDGWSVTKGCFLPDYL